MILAKLALAVARIARYAISCGLYYKSFTVITDDRNDSSLYYKTTLLDKAKLILANLALAKGVNYDCKVCSRLEPCDRELQS